MPAATVNAKNACPAYAYCYRHLLLCISAVKIKKYYYAQCYRLCWNLAQFNDAKHDKS